MEKQSAFSKEPRVVFDVVFEVNGIALPKKEICLFSHNLTKDDVVDAIEKERKKIFEILEDATMMEMGTALVDGSEIPIDPLFPIVIHYSSAIIKESFLNSNLRPSDKIINRSFH